MIAHRQIRTEEEVESLLQSIMKEALRRFPALIPYKRILEFVFTAFYRQDGLIFFKENEEGAYISPDMVHGQYVYYLNIGILNRTNPITVLWSILHEYGHTLQEIEQKQSGLTLCSRWPVKQMHGIRLSSYCLNSICLMKCLKASGSFAKTASIITAPN